MNDPQEVLSTYIGDWDGVRDSTPVWLNGLHVTVGVTVMWMTGQMFAQASRIYWGIGFDQNTYEWLLHSSDPDQSSLSKGYSYTLPENWDILTRGDYNGKDQ